MDQIKYLLFALLVGTITYECEADRKHLSRFKNNFNIKNYHSNAKHEYIGPHFERLQRQCPGASEKIIKADQLFEECTHRILSNRSATMCTKLEQMMLNCGERIYSKIVDDCSSEKAKGLFSLIMKSFISVIDYLCKQTGEIIIELNRSCLWNDPEEVHEVMEQCKERIKHRAIWYRDNGFMTTEVCRDLFQLRDCVETRGTQNCKCLKTKQAFIGLYDAVIAPCKNIIQN